MTTPESKKYLIMCVGHTHSGKTTFAKNLLEKAPEIVLIDNDTIAEFVMRTYPVLAKSDYNKSKKTMEDPNMKFLLWKQVVEFSMSAGKNIILSNGNLGQDIRDYIIDISNEHNYEVVTIYFNVPKEILLKRIEATTKDTKMFITSKNWIEVFEKQQGYAELPPKKDTTHFFEISKSEDTEIVMAAILNVL